MLYIQSRQFQKFERLSAKRSIAFLFEQGQSFVMPPIKIVWKITQEPQFPVTVLFSVPKKNFPVSPDRSRIKRLMREAYRLHKSGFIGVVAEKNIYLQVAFIFIGKQLPEYTSVEEKIISALKKLHHELETMA